MGPDCPLRLRRRDARAGSVVGVSGGCELGNHTFDHLESNSGWPGIPAQYKNPPFDDGAPGVGWLFNATTGLGPGVSMDEATWEAVIAANDSELKTLYATPSTTITGFRAPRLEINDNGLNAIKASTGYQYDQDMEETQPDGFVAAAVAADTVNAKPALPGSPGPTRSTTVRPASGTSRSPATTPRSATT